MKHNRFGSLLILLSIALLSSCWSDNSVIYTGPPPRTTPLDSAALVGADEYSLSRLPKTLEFDFRVDGDQPCSVKVELRDSGTRLVRRLIDSVYSPGLHKITWDATDSNKVRIRPSFYYYKMYICGKSSTRQLDYRRHWQ
jgi:hypothetical protein